jgi:transcriptional regulator with XRE-family HTH domain
MAKTKLDGLGDRLRMARQRIDPELTLKQAGKAVGRSGPCIGQWELGSSEPGLSDLMTLAGVYGVAPEWLLGINTSAARATENMMLSSRGVGANSVPVLSSADAIAGQIVSTDYVQAGRAYANGTAFAWIVDTDAMTRCATGDIAIIERGEAVTTNGMFMILAKGSEMPTLRRCRFDQGRPVFVPDATEFPIYNNHEATVIGRVREIIKHIPIE